VTGLATHDELGILGDAFDTLLGERVATLSEVERERDALNDSIIEVLGSVAKLSQKDLTIKGVVAEGIRRTQEAGERMGQTETTTDELVAAVQTIAAALEQQTRTALALMKRSQAIVKTTEETSEQLKEQSAHTLSLLVRERWPEMAVHLSVQADTVNAAAVRFWQGVGVTRVILLRELSLEEIAEFRQACPDMELEVFVHGALCIACSGRCLLSGYFNHGDANQGSCTNSCRWGYRAPSSRCLPGD